MNIEPTSDEAKDAVWAEYEALDEKRKREITRHTARTRPKLFKYWVHIAGLDRGFDQRRVASRGGTYGKRLDTALKGHKDGGFTVNVFTTFLIKTGVVDTLLSGAPDNVVNEEFERFVDKKAAESNFEYAAFAAAYVKCYPPENVGKTSLADAAAEEMTGFVTQLDKHAVKLEEWAGLLRLTGYLPQPTTWIASVTRSSYQMIGSRKLHLSFSSSVKGRNPHAS